MGTSLLHCSYALIYYTNKTDTSVEVSVLILLNFLNYSLRLPRLSSPTL